MCVRATSHGLLIAGCFGVVSGTADTLRCIRPTYSLYILGSVAPVRASNLTVKGLSTWGSGHLEPAGMHWILHYGFTSVEVC